MSNGVRSPDGEPIKGRPFRSAEKMPDALGSNKLPGRVKSRPGSETSYGLKLRKEQSNFAGGSFC
jgi:hypothetical protein